MNNYVVVNFDLVHGSWIYPTSHILAPTMYEARAALRQMQKEAEDPDKDLQAQLEEAEPEDGVPQRGRGRGRGKGKGRGRGRSASGKGRGRGRGRGSEKDDPTGAADHVDVPSRAMESKPSSCDNAEGAADLSTSKPGPAVDHVDSGKNDEIEATSSASMEVLASPRKPSIKRKRSKLNKLRVMSQSPRQRRQRKKKVDNASEPGTGVEPVAKSCPPPLESLPESSEGDKEKTDVKPKRKAKKRTQKVEMETGGTGSGKEDANEKNDEEKREKEKAIKEHYFLADCCGLGLGFWCDFETIGKLCDVGPAISEQ